MAGKINRGKAKEVLSKTFVENHATISEDEAEHLIARCEQRIKALKEEREADEKLSAAKQIVKDLEGGYKSAVTYERAKIDYLLGKLEELQENTVNPTSGLREDQQAQ